VTRGLDERDRADLRRALRGMRVYPLDARSAARAAALWRELEAAGRRIGDRDVLTAAIALSAGLPILARNVEHFRRVPGLRLAR